MIRRLAILVLLHTMALSRFEGFVGPSAQNRSLTVACDRTVNLIPEIVDSGTPKARIVYHAAPGFAEFCELPDYPIRGLWAGENRLFVAAGSHLYEVYSDATYRVVGSIPDLPLAGGGAGWLEGTTPYTAASSPVQIFPNGNQLFVVAGGNAFVADGIDVHQPALGTYTDLVIHPANPSGFKSAANPFTRLDAGMYFNITGGTGFDVQRTKIEYVDEDGYGYSANPIGTPGSTEGTGIIPLTCGVGAFLDGYFIAAPPFLKKIYVSALWDGNTWDPLDYAVKEGDPFAIRALLADHKELWVFGSQSTEVWTNTGGEFPFEPIRSAFIEQGCWAPWSVAKVDNSIMWLGGDPRGAGVVWRANGYTPQRVSSHALEAAMQSYSRIDDAEAYSFQDGGHQFYVLTFPTADATWVYDASTQMWSEWAAWSGGIVGFGPGDSGQYHRHRSRGHAYVWGKHLVGDFETGHIYEMSMSLHDFAGSPRRWLRVAPHLSNNNQVVFCGEVQLLMETGTAPEEMPSPSVAMCFSRDGGRNYGSERSRPMGTAGQTVRLRWLRPGRFRDGVFQFYGSDPVKTTIIDALIDVQPGNGA